ncbi:TonB-dependent receptor [Paraglaciecola sp.]|uniref:TonB-dependent receptor n=1 Tax=Paraglaciecola sp. TaxID=1920173 RepID=UPI0030F413DB
MTIRRFNKITQSIKGAVILGAATTVGIIPAVSFAQQAEAPDTTEVIQVRGIAASQKEALNQKRYANAVIDSISSVDIGKFPDRNIAESLQRVPGVTISRNFAGEGGSVSIRGTNPELTLVTMNGNYVASTGWFSQQPATRSFDMDLLPPELVAGVDVYKSPMASLDEGGVGGVVEVRTRKPLSIDSGTLYLSAEAQSNSIADDTGYGATGMYSWKNDAENFGILGSLSTLETIGLAHKAENYMDDGWAGAGIAEFKQTRKRDAIDLTLEYAPSDQLFMNLHYFNVDLNAGNTNQNYLIIPAGDAAGFNANVTGATTFAPVSGVATNGVFSGAPLDESISRNAEMNTKVIAYEITYEADTYTINSKIGQTKATGGDGGNYVVAWGSNNENQSIKFDMTGRDAMLLMPINTDPSNHAEYNMNSQSVIASHREDDETFAQVDVNFDVEWGVISKLRTGVKIRSHENTSFANTWQFREGVRDGMTKANFADGHFNHSGVGLVSGSPTNIARIDGEQVKAYLNSFKSGETLNENSYGVISEDILATYVQGDFDGDNYRGNLGVRYIQTDTSADYRDFFDTSQQASEESDYSDFLPSFNLAVDLREDLVLRASASKVISRPNYTFMNPAATTNLNTLQITRGTVTLDPFRATQADIGIEWYFNDESLLSATIFKKDIQSFIIQGANKSTIVNDGLTFTLNEPGQGLGGQIQGAEFQYQQQMGNFGWSANLTYSDGFGEQDMGADAGGIVEIDLPGLSKYSYNLTAFYENETFSGRIAYTYRDNFIAQSTGIGGNTSWDAHGFMDANVTWHATESISVSLEATNLLEETTTQRLSTEYDAMRLAADNGRNLYLKVSYRL